jgi:hypothetical protein
MGWTETCEPSARDLSRGSGSSAGERVVAKRFGNLLRRYFGEMLFSCRTTAVGMLTTAETILIKNKNNTQSARNHINPFRILGVDAEYCEDIYTGQ